MTFCTRQTNKLIYQKTKTLLVAGQVNLGPGLIHILVLRNRRVSRHQCTSTPTAYNTSLISPARHQNKPEFYNVLVGVSDDKCLCIVCKGCCDKSSVIFDKEITRLTITIFALLFSQTR